jgi:hypothetical protein
MSGQIGYEAYRAHTGGVSLATGQSIPEWQHLKPEIQAAWDAAGTALRADLEVAQKRIAELEAERDALAACLEVAKTDAYETWESEPPEGGTITAFEFFLRKAGSPLADALFGPHGRILAAIEARIRRAVEKESEHRGADDPLAGVEMVKCLTFLPEAQGPRVAIRVGRDLWAQIREERDALAAALEVAKQDAFETWRHDQGADDSLEAYEYFLREAEYPLADAFFGPHASVLAARDRHVREQVIDALLAEVAGREHPIPEYDPWCRGGAHGINHERARLRAILLAAKEASGQ